MARKRRKGNKKKRSSQRDHSIYSKTARLLRTKYYLPDSPKRRKKLLKSKKRYLVPAISRDRQKEYVKRERLKQEMPIVRRQAPVLYFDYDFRRERVCRRRSDRRKISHQVRIIPVQIGICGSLMR